jgi:hypothetical protein
MLAEVGASVCSGILADSGADVGLGLLAEELHAESTKDITSTLTPIVVRTNPMFRLGYRSCLECVAGLTLLIVDRSLLNIENLLNLLAIIGDFKGV